MIDLYQSLLSEARDDNICSVVVGLVVTEGEKVLLLKRKSDKYFGGMWEFPSGRLEFGESVNDCLYRQAEEKLDQQIKAITKYIGCFDYVSKDGKKTRQLNFKVVLESKDNFSLSEKHSDYKFFNLNEAVMEGNVSKETMYIMDVAESYYKYKQRKEKIYDNRKRG